MRVLWLLWHWLSGKKTYGVAGAMIVVAGLYAEGYIDDKTFTWMEGLLMGTGYATLRHGLHK